jgi:hypothetical protein
MHAGLTLFVVSPFLSSFPPRHSRGEPEHIDFAAPQPPTEPWPPNSQHHHRRWAAPLAPSTTAVCRQHHLLPASYLVHVIDRPSRASIVAGQDATAAPGEAVCSSQRCRLQPGWRTFAAPSESLAARAASICSSSGGQLQHRRNRLQLLGAACSTTSTALQLHR